MANLSVETQAGQQRATVGDGELRPNREEASVLQEVLRALRRIRYGQVQLNIQDGRVVQIDQTEKVRLA